MKRSMPCITLVIATLVIATLGFGPTAFAERDLPRFIERCVAAIQAHTEETVGGMERICAKTIEGIEAAIAEGDPELAEMIAREGAARLSRAASRGGRELREGVERCLEIIRRHGGRDQAGPILDAAVRCMEAIGHANRACLRAIGEALGRDGDGRPPGETHRRETHRLEIHRLEIRRLEIRRREIRRRETRRLEIRRRETRRSDDRPIPARTLRGAPGACGKPIHIPNEIQMNQRHLANAELAVMELLWAEEGLTARVIRDRLYPDATKAQHGTVQRLLQRLEDKGFVERDRSLPVHLFSAAISRGSYACGQLESLADKLTGGSLAPLITHLMEQKRISRGEIEKLRQILSDDSQGSNDSQGGAA